MTTTGIFAGWRLRELPEEVLDRFIGGLCLFLVEVALAVEMLCPISLAACPNVYVNIA